MPRTNASLLTFESTERPSVDRVLLGRYVIGGYTRVRDGRRCFVDGGLDLPGLPFKRQARTPATMRTLMERHMRTWLHGAGLAYGCNGTITLPKAPAKGQQVRVTYTIEPKPKKAK